MSMVMIPEPRLRPVGVERKGMNSAEFEPLNIHKAVRLGLALSF